MAFSFLEFPILVYGLSHSTPCIMSPSLPYAIGRILIIRDKSEIWYQLLQVNLEIYKFVGKTDI